YSSFVVTTDAAKKAPLVKSLIREVWRDDLSPGMKETLIGRIRQSGGGAASQVDEAPTMFEELLPKKYQAKSIEELVEKVKTEWLNTHAGVTPSILQMQVGIPQSRSFDVYQALQKAGLIDDVGRKLGGEIEVATKAIDIASPEVKLPEAMSVIQAKELRALGYTADDIIKMEKSRWEDILFESIQKSASPFEKPWTLESLRQTAKEYELDPNMLTEESVKLANQIGKDRVIEILTKSQIEEVKLAETGKIPEEKTKQISFFEEQARLEGKKDVMYSVRRHTPEVEGGAPSVASIKSRPRADIITVSRGAESSMKDVGAETYVGVEGKPTIIYDAAELVDPKLRRQTLYHENLHVDLLPTTQSFEAPIMEKSTLEAGEQIASGLKSAHPSHYGKISKGHLLEEAYVHASSALRTGDSEYLATLAAWDKDLPHVLRWIREMSGHLRNDLAKMPDSIYKRSLQRKLSDLLRRSDDDTLTHLREFVDEFGVPDLVNGKFVYRMEGKETVLGSLKSVHDYIDARDVSNQVASFTGRLEDLGVRGVSFMPARSRGLSKTGGDPLPEVPLEVGDLKSTAVSWLYKPFLNWAGKAQEMINTALVRQGRVAIDIYNPIKDIDDAVLMKTRKGDQLAEKLEKVLPLGDAKHYDYTMWLSHAPSDRPEIAAKLR
ncbi:hypothetical protein LCGC14_2105660, partial [marine sediment metagenome]